MNAYELQALRHIFAMTIDECATWIAQTGDSESWRQWENGKCAIPDRVVEQLLAMRQQRKKHLHACIEKTVCHSRQKAKNISDNDVIGLQDAKKEGHIATHPESNQTTNNAREDQDQR